MQQHRDRLTSAPHLGVAYLGQALVNRSQLIAKPPHLDFEPALRPFRIPDQIEQRGKLNERSTRPLPGRADCRAANAARRSAHLSALIAVDGHRIAMTWLPLTGSVLVDFVDVESKRIGTVVMRESGPGFVAQPGHSNWLRYEERKTRLLCAAARRREVVAFEWQTNPCP
ncbi:hypothetical protein [Glycomyces tritici]|uniref:Uncharacterized protein n=1 Tax=Glycomyces tritici TaxID=2665176 RepID=A0ABT7YXN3_9ACTN|nr:hypothetical protein [Glycomyces tritici]MDN3243415.1 hypothetical protein [Glycomyces tritici]